MCPKYIFNARQASEGAIFVPFSMVSLFVLLLMMIFIFNFLKNSIHKSLLLYYIKALGIPIVFLILSLPYSTL